MSTILMPINPEPTSKILSGVKKYEYRKIKPKKEIDKIIIYETYPVMKVVGEITINEILEDSIENIWNLTKEDSGATKEFFFNYYKGKIKAVAYKIHKVIKYNEPKELIEFGINYIPQSFVYIDK